MNWQPIRTLEFNFYNNPSVPAVLSTYVVYERLEQTAGGFYRTESGVEFYFNFGNRAEFITLYVDTPLGIKVGLRAPLGAQSNTSQITDAIGRGAVTSAMKITLYLAEIKISTRYGYLSGFFPKKCLANACLDYLKSIPKVDIPHEMLREGFGLSYLVPTPIGFVSVSLLSDQKRLRQWITLYGITATSVRMELDQNEY